MVSEFLAVLEKLKIEPNFWSSREYIRRAGLQVIQSNGLLAVVDNGTDWAVLPALDPKSGKAVSFPGLSIWSDFYGTEFDYAVPQFLDYEYLYDPRAFLDLSGSKWSVFRKNIKKWPRERTHLYYEPLINVHKKDIENVLIEWLESLGKDQEIHDDAVMLDYLLYGDNRYGLFDRDRLVGINVWDYSWKYINYRYCICRPEPFLSEYMRYLFYMDTNLNTLVNDGGVLDRPSLKAFKDRLNPVRVREVMSWL